MRPVEIETIVVGGGISGLACAFRLHERHKPFLLLEAAERVGGVIESEPHDDFLVEKGPNSVLAAPELLEMSRELELKPLLAPERMPRFIYHDGRLKPLPMGPISLLGSSLFTWRGKLRLLEEPFVPPRTDPEEESVASFFTRRFGPESVERAVGPFVSGIFAGDPEQLSVGAAFPRLVELERKYGSVLKGFLRSARKGRKERAKETPGNPVATDRKLHRRICSFPGGLSTLITALHKRLAPSIRLGTPVIAIRKSGEHYLLRTREEHFLARNVVLATPAGTSARLTEELDSALPRLLHEIPYSPLVVVATGFSREDVPLPLEGFGFLVSRWQEIRILGTIWSSSLFPMHAPTGYHLLTTFIGGFCDPQILGFSDDAILSLLERDFDRILGIHLPPRFHVIKRHSAAIPHYSLGHVARLAAIEEHLSAHPRLLLIGNYLQGVSVGDCIRRAFEAADRI